MEDYAPHHNHWQFSARYPGSSAEPCCSQVPEVASRKKSTISDFSKMIEDSGRIGIRNHYGSMEAIFWKIVQQSINVQVSVGSKRNSTHSVKMEGEFGNFKNGLR